MKGEEDKRGREGSGREMRAGDRSCRVCFRQRWWQEPEKWMSSWALCLEWADEKVKEIRKHWESWEPREGPRVCRQESARSVGQTSHHARRKHPQCPRANVPLCLWGRLAYRKGFHFCVLQTL